MREVIFNASKIHMDSDLLFSYIYDALKKNPSHSNDTSQCLAAVPSTETWVFIDCAKVMQNVTFLCEYTPLPIPGQKPSFDFKPNMTQTYNNTQYCDKDWNLIDQYCVRIVRITKSYLLDMSEITSVCTGIKGKLFDQVGSVPLRIKSYIPSFLKQGYHLVIISKHKTGIAAMLVGSSSHLGHVNFPDFRSWEFPLDIGPDVNIRVWYI